MEEYDKNKQSYLKYWDVNNLYGWALYVAKCSSRYI